MLGLWGDVWFYISGAGFLASLAFFGFLLGQYRVAVQAGDHGELESLPPMAAPLRVMEISAAPSPVLIQPAPKEALEKTLVLPPETPRADTTAKMSVPPSPAAVQAEAPASVPIPSPAPAARKENITGSLSPAVVYLQNIKGQIDGLDKEVSSLKSAVIKQSAQNEAILNHILELAAQMKTAGSASAAPVPVAAAPVIVPVPVPEPFQSAAPVPAPVPIFVSEAVPEPAPIAKEEPPAVVAPAVAAPLELTSPQQAASSPGPDMPTLELKPAPDSAAPAQQQPEAAAQDKPARKGPVWPI